MLCFAEPHVGLGKIHWAIRGNQELPRIYARLPEYKNVAHEVHDVPVPPHRPMVTKGHMAIWGCPLADGVEDWGVYSRSGRQYTYRGCALLNHVLAKVGKFKLPKEFTLVQPTTPVNNPTQRGIRDFRPEDWAGALRVLEERDDVGVVLNVGGDPIPEHPRLIDLTGKTTVAESVEIAKRAHSYLGIDSWLSILCSKFLPRHRLVVLSRNPQFFNDAHIYMAPHAKYDFVVTGF